MVGTPACGAGRRRYAKWPCPSCYLETICHLFGSQALPLLVPRVGSSRNGFTATGPPPRAGLRLSWRPRRRGNALSDVSGSRGGALGADVEVRSVARVDARGSP